MAAPVELIVSEQGVALTRVERHEPEPAGATRSDTVDGLDPEHHHLVWSARSGLQVRTSHRSFVIASPHGMWIPSSQPYVVEASTPWQAAHFVASSCSPSWQRMAQIPLAETTAPILARLGNGSSRRWSSQLLSAVVEDLEHAFVSQPLPLRFPSDPRAREIADARVGDPAAASDLAEWAGRVGASVRTLRRLFLRETGLPFARWRLRLRMQTAMRLLGDGAAINEVARRCGYASVTTFARTFSTEIGVSPSRYRLRQGPDGLVSQTTDTWPIQIGDRPPGRGQGSQPLSVLVDGLTREGTEMSDLGRRLALISLGAALVLAGCGDSDADSADATAATAPTESTSSTGAGPTTADDDANDGGLESMTGDGDADDEGPEPSTDQPDTFVWTGLDGPIEVPRAPQRIVALQDQNAMLPLLELGITPVGSVGRLDAAGQQFFARVDDFDTSDVEWIGQCCGEVNLEAVAALSPDLIVTDMRGGAEQLAELRELAPVARVDVGDQPVTDALAQWAELFPGESASLEPSYVAAVDELSGQLGDASEITVAYIVPFFDEGEFGYVDTGQAPLQVVNDLGLSRPELAADTGFDFVSLELFPDHEADIVLIADFTGDDALPTAQEFADLPVVQPHPAIRAGQWAAIDGTQAVGTGWTKLINFTEQLVPLLTDETLDRDIVVE